MMTIQASLKMALFSGVLLLASCAVDDNTPAGVLDEELESLLLQSSKSSGIDYYIIPSETDFSNIPQDPKNPLSAVKVQLGKFLFHETALGIVPKVAQNRTTYSCASCHHVEAGFSAGKAQGIGEGGMGFGSFGESRLRDPGTSELDMDVQPLKSPTALNSAYQENMLWNGQFGATAHNEGTEALWVSGKPFEVNHLGYHGVESQAIAGMGVHRQDINEQLVEELRYKGYFDLAFPDFPKEKRYTKETAGLAMAAYERTLLSNGAPFQKWLRGQTQAMTDKEKEGAILFFGKAGCVSCHNGPSLALNEFYAVGMSDLFECPDEVFNTHMQDPANLGRASFTMNPQDKYKFKVPQLYNLTDIHFLGHGASFTSVYDVVKYFNEGIPQNNRVPVDQLDVRFKPLGLADDEVEAIALFLEKALYDPKLTRFVPSSLPTGNCFPNADPASRRDLGCN